MLHAAHPLEKQTPACTFCDGVQECKYCHSGLELSFKELGVGESSAPFKRTKDSMEHTIVNVHCNQEDFNIECTLNEGFIEERQYAPAEVKTLLKLALRQQQRAFQSHYKRIVNRTLNEQYVTFCTFVQDFVQRPASSNETSYIK